MTSTMQLARAISLIAGLAISTSAFASSDIASDRHFKHSATTHPSLIVAREQPAKAPPAKEDTKAAAAEQMNCPCHAKS
jgi:hypothetical protein